MMGPIIFYVIKLMNINKKVLNQIFLKLLIDDLLLVIFLNFNIRIIKNILIIKKKNIWDIFDYYWELEVLKEILAFSFATNFDTIARNSLL